MSILDSAVLLLQAKNYSGSGDWLDESGNGHDAQFGDGSTPSTYPTHAGTTFRIDSGDYFLIADHADIDFGAADSFTLMIAVSVDNPTSGTQAWLDKGSMAGPTGSAYAMWSASDRKVNGSIADGTLGTSRSSVSAEVVAGELGAFWFVRDVGEDKIKVWRPSSQDYAASTDSTTATLAGALDLFIGRYAPVGTLWLTGNVAAVAIWRSAISEAEAKEAAALLTPEPVGSHLRYAGPGQLLRTGG